MKIQKLTEGTKVAVNSRTHERRSLHPSPHPLLGTAQAEWPGPWRQQLLWRSMQEVRLVRLHEQEGRTHRRGKRQGQRYSEKKKKKKKKED